MVDFYDESQHYYDIEIKKFKEALRKEVKQEFLNEMERLKKENLELQEVKRNLEKIESDLRETRRKVKQERFEELLKDVALPITVYGIDTALAYKPLCGHCDNRVIHFNSPSGRELTEICPECGLSFSKWTVFPLERSKICIFEDHRCWSIYETSIHTEWQDRKWKLKTINLYQGKIEIPEKQALEIFYFNKNVFESRERAQKMCDWLNRDLPADLELETNT